MNFRWYEPLAPTTSISMASGWCTRCSTWWMGHHECPYEPVTPEEAELEARIRRIVDRAVREFVR